MKEIICFCIGMLIGLQIASGKCEQPNIASVSEVRIIKQQPKQWTRQSMDAWARSVNEDLKK